MTSVQNGRSERVLADPARSAQLGMSNFYAAYFGYQLVPPKALLGRSQSPRGCARGAKAPQKQESQRAKNSL
jgi:hypothetical protein